MTIELRGELDVLADLLAGERARFSAAPGDARAFLAAGAYRAPGHLDRAELAAWTTVASALLNTSEVITRP